MPGRDIIVIGFFAGGDEALARVVADLPCDQQAARLGHHFPVDLGVAPETRSRLAVSERT